MNNKLNVHLTQKGVLIGTDSPVGITTPQFIGQHYITEEGHIYISYGLNENCWTRIQSGQPLLISIPTYNDLKLLPLTSVTKGAKFYVEELDTYYKLVDNTWVMDTSYVVQDQEPVDKSVIWVTPSGTVLNDDNSKITVEELVANISVLVTRLNGLVKVINNLEDRITYLEENGFNNNNNNNSSGGISDNAILLENGKELLLESGKALKLEG